MLAASDKDRLMTADWQAPGVRTGTGYVSRFVTAQDGLKLHVRDYGSPLGEALPLVCLPGLARTGADFHALAHALAAHPDAARRVLALDFRGRGRSEYDRSPANYNLAVELSDLIAVLTALDIGTAVFVGTSRGGMLAMLLAAARPAALAGCVLNDIGPVIEPKGLVRIKSYVGKLPQPASFEEAADILRRLFDAQFPKLGAEQWLDFAHRTFTPRDGRLVPDYDPALRRILDGVNLEAPLPALWREFEALARVPVLVLRGANSDILSQQTVAAMRARSSRVEAIEVADQGHTPLLAEPDTIARIALFAQSCQRALRH
jgi:pimeloyl-ACP methyl ester carboxylesterase